MTDLRLGALCWKHYTTWDALKAAGTRADLLGFDDLWTWDLLQSSIGPVFGDRTGPGCTAVTMPDHRPLTDR